MFSCRRGFVKMAPYRGGRQPGSRNHRRTAASTTEDFKTYLRLSENEVDYLADEFLLWKRANAFLRGQSTRLQWRPAYRAMQVFLAYLARGGYFHQASNLYFTP